MIFHLSGRLDGTHVAGETLFFIWFLSDVFTNMWLTGKLEYVAQVANINKLPGTDSFTSPPKDAVTDTSSF